MRWVRFRKAPRVSPAEGQAEGGRGRATDVPEGLITSYQLGEAMRRVREAQGLSLDEMARMTHIRVSALKILEAGDFAKLPGPTFVVGFLRLMDKNLRNSELSRMILHFIGQISGQEQLSFHEAPSIVSRNRPGIRLTVGTVVIFLGLFVAYERYHAEARDFFKALPPVAPGPIALREVGKAVAGKDPRAGGAEMVREVVRSAGSATWGAEPLEGKVVDPPEVGMSSKGRAFPGGAAATAPGSLSSSSEGAAGATGAKSGVVLVADKTSWIQLLDQDGKVWQSRTLQAGEQWPVPAEGRYFATIGNPSGVHPQVNGKDLPPFGKSSTKALRKVDLTPGALIQRKRVEE